MSSHPVMFFQAAALRQRYLDDLAAAAAEARITAAQHQWLELLVESIRVARNGKVRPQVGRLSTADGFWETTGACTGLLLGSEQPGDWTMFWYSPFTGLRQFASRKRLVEALSGWLDLPASEPPHWSVEWFAADPFEQLETLLIGGHAECLGRLGDQLLQLPSLVDLLGAPEPERFAEALVEPGQPLLERGQTGLDDFWRHAAPGWPTRRHLAAQALADGWGCALMAARQRGELSEPEFSQLRTLLPSGAGPAGGLTAGTLALAAGGHSVQLAGVLVVNLAAAVVVFSAWGGLRRFATLGEHEAYFNEPVHRRELLACVSLAEHALVIGVQAVQLRVQWLAQGHFLRLTDGCLAWQARNLKQGLSKLHAPLSVACGAIDDAQDIRHLLDGRLPAVGGRGRWRELAGQSAEPSTQVLRPLADGEPAVEQWGDFQLRALRQIDAIAALQPGAGTCARELLGLYLALFDAPQLWVRIDDSSPVSLVTLFLQRLSGYSPATLPAHAQVLDGAESLPADQRKISPLSAQQLDSLLKLAAKAFDAAFDAQVRRSRTRGLRVQGQQLHPAKLAEGLLTGLLRQVLALEQRLARLKAANLSMLEQALQYPALSQRRRFGQQAVEVYGLVVHYDVRQPGATLHGSFVLQRSTSNLSTLLLWLPFSGLQEFDSDARLQVAFRLGLTDPATRAQWLGQVSEPARSRLSYTLAQPDAASPVVHLVAIEDSFVEHIQAGETQRQCQDVIAAMQFARSRRCAVQRLENTLAAAQAQDGVRNAIDALAKTVELGRFSSVLPSWMAEASAIELDHLAELLQRYYMTHTPALDFMSGVPGLQTYARDKLLAALSKDFPGAGLNPDFIPLGWVQYTPAPVSPGEVPSALPAATRKVRGSLTDYAVNRLFSPPDAFLTVDVAGGFEGSSRLDIAYLERLVRQLDVAASYRILLAQAFSPHDVEYPGRLQRFSLQFPARLRLAAVELKLRKLLSARAVAFIERILDMPDGRARKPQGGEPVLICPLQLLAEPGRAANLASGIYLIGSAAGPWVLLALLAESVELREYADLAAVLAGLQNDAPLAELVLQRLDPQARRLYIHGGFKEPHLAWSTEDSFGVPWASPSPPQLLLQPLLGNACKHIFEATLTVLLAQAREQTVTNAEHDRAAWRFLLSLGTDQLLAFLPGKLGLAVAAWQAALVAGQALDAARQHRWGEAFAQFCAALAMLASTRQEAAARQPGVALEAAPVVRLPDPVQERLRQFEVHDVSVSELEKDALFNLYRDPLRNHRYAIVAGKLYRVRADAGGWRIVWHEVDGPSIRLDQAQQWELRLGLKGGGPLMSRFENTLVDLSLDDIFTVKAAGLEEIRRVYPDHARRIGQAHLWACNYVRTALRNMDLEPSTGQLPAATRTLLEDFFGVSSADATLVGQVRDALDALMSALMEPSLSPFSSKRFVIGACKQGYEDIPAFTYSNDGKRRIFMGHRYFRPTVIRLKPPPSGQNGFDQGAHFRATVLLHELSHIAHGSLDIAYVEAVSPYLNLIEDTGDYYKSVKRNVERYQMAILSHLTPRDELFVNTTSPDSPRDLNNTDGGALAGVLRLTGSKTLDEARDVFLQQPLKRSAVILANADSVALLVTLLGRTPFATPPP